MRAIEVTEFGGPEVLAEVKLPDPEPGAGEVLIRVAYAEVLFVDTQLRTGWGQQYFALRPPWVPGTGVAGEVVAVGTDVADVRVGDRVVARTGDAGGYAELVVTAADQAYLIPDGVDAAVATAALHDAPLALSRLELAEIRRGERVLVTAAAGSLGHWFVPLSAAAGATVVGAAGGPFKTRAVDRLGAADAVDYLAPAWADQLGDLFDVVFDGTGGDVGRVAYAHTRDGGRFFAHGSAAGDPGASERDNRDVEVVAVTHQLTDEQWHRYTERGLELLAAGTVRPTIGQQIPLVAAARAHQAMADRTVIGKTVLTV